MWFHRGAAGDWDEVWLTAAVLEHPEIHSPKYSWKLMQHRFGVWISMDFIRPQGHFG